MTLDDLVFEIRIKCGQRGKDESQTSSISLNHIAKMLLTGPNNTNHKEAQKNEDELLDAEGVKWNPDIHSPNKVKTKTGVWRKKKNAAEALVNMATSKHIDEDDYPMPKHGEEDEYPVTGYEDYSGPLKSLYTNLSHDVSDEGLDSEPVTAPTEASEPVAAPTENSEEEDDFSKDDFVYTDANLSSLANKKAQELKDSKPVLDLIKGYVPFEKPSTISNIPKLDRAHFVHDLEQLKKSEDITF